jgi:RNA polymerase sigma-70 factor (ECF subfamily)
MAAGPLGSVMRYIRRVADPTDVAEPTDGFLLERFASGQEEDAFAVLVRRHGGMVFGVCRRVLNDTHDAEDAFQATFLVLARKAASIAHRESVGSWLHGVAYRTALKARDSAARRRARERQTRPMSDSDPFMEVAWRELRPILDAELDRLPEKYRAPVVLCYLEGKTNEEAAMQLGWTKGTVSGRLARARDLLRRRLTRRGLALSAGLLATALSARASATVPTVLSDATLQSALQIAAGKAVAVGAVSAQAAALSEGVLRTMFLTKLKMVAALVLVVSLTGAGVTVLGSYPSGQLPFRTAQDEKPKADKPGSKKSGKDEEKIIGTWLATGAEEGGNKLTGERLDQIKLIRVVITAEKISLKPAGGDDEVLIKYKLDPSTDPRTIEMTIEKAANGLTEGKTVKGRYSLDGDRLKLCFSEKEEDAPTDLKTQEGTTQFLLDLKRRPAGQKDTKEEIAKGADANKRILSSNNLKQIALAMVNYESAYGHLPQAAIQSADGTPLLSWRVMILPFIEQNDLYKQFKLDEPWDSEHNKPLLAQMPKIYAPPPGVKTKEENTTFYQVLTGKDTVFESGAKIRLMDITDGTSNTILAVEAADPVPWTKPADLAYEADKDLPKLGGLLQTGFNMAMCDGSVHFVPKKFNAKKLRAFITRNDGERVDLEELKKGN